MCMMSWAVKNNFCSHRNITGLVNILSHAPKFWSNGFVWTFLQGLNTIESVACCVGINSGLATSCQNTAHTHNETEMNCLLVY